MATVVEWKRGTPTFSSSRLEVAFASTPAAGEVIVVAAVSLRTSGPRPSLAPIQGYGVTTWTQVYQPTGSRVAYWVGVADGVSAAPVVVTYNGTGPQADGGAYRIAGATTDTAADGASVASGTAVAGPTLTAGPGQVALSVATLVQSTAGTATLTFPSAQTPAGWTAAQAPSDANYPANFVASSYRLPSTSEDHRTDAAATSAVNLAVTTLILGTESGGTPDPATISLSGTSPAATAALSVNHEPPTPTAWSVELAGTAPAATASLDLTRGTSSTIDSATEQVDRSNGRVRACEWTVTVEPPIVTPSRELGHDYATATSLPTPTLVNGRPT